MRRPKIELCATPRAQHVQDHDALPVLWDHRTEPPVEIVAFDIRLDPVYYTCAVIKERLQLAQQRAVVWTGAVVRNEAHIVNQALSQGQQDKFPHVCGRIHLVEVHSVGFLSATQYVSEEGR